MSLRMRYIGRGYVENITGYLAVPVVKKYLNNKEEISYMKKLLVLALAVVMVLAFAAVSMAAPTVTVGGLVAFETVNTTDLTKVVMNDIDCTNIHVVGQLSDDVSVHAQLDFGNAAGKNDITLINPYWDATYLQVANFGPGTLQMGHTTWGTTGLDILSSASGMGVFDFNYEVALGGGLKVKLGDTVATDAAFASNLPNAVQVNYSQDAITANVYYAPFNSSYDVYFAYKLSDTVTLKVVDGAGAKVTGVDQKSQYGVEAAFAQGALGGFLEYDNLATNNAQITGQVSYAMDNGFTTILRVKNVAAVDATPAATTTYLECKVGF